MIPFIGSSFSYFSFLIISEVMVQYPKKYSQFQDTYDVIINKIIDLIEKK